MNPSTRLDQDRDQLRSLYAPIAPALQEVEQILRTELSSDYPFVDELVRYGFRLGGKRLRPALVLLVGEALGRIGNEHLLLGAVVEMIHTATLIHDDVLDEARTRRHLATVNARWDNQASVLLGDYLFTHAFYLASTLESTLACRLIGRATNIVCEGEIRQKGSCGDYSLSESEYIEIIASKTAELCACSCELGARYAGASAELAQQLSGYGRDLGIAFQIVDDVLDLMGDESTTGKSLGTDFQQGIPTLPIIRVLDQLKGEDREQLVAVLQDSTDDPRTTLVPLLKEHNAIEYALERARHFARRARAAVIELPNSAAADVLKGLPDFVVERSS